jgi:hypothetical protein
MRIALTVNNSVDHFILWRKTTLAVGRAVVRKGHFLSKYQLLALEKKNRK